MGSYYNYQNLVSEITLSSNLSYKNPFNEVELNIYMIDPNGKELVIPAFWAGKNTWKFRYASSTIGEHKFKTVCTKKTDTGLNGKTGIIKISKYSGENKLFRHGRLKVSEKLSDNLEQNNRKIITHLDGTPFLWLGDSWYSAFTDRFRWPDIFKILTEDRVQKGFSVIQLTAGLFPGFGEEFNEYERNEAGYVWDNNFDCINPSYFDMSDIKIFWLVESGIIPCIFGSWGYYINWLGIEKMKKHWRYIIARWGAYPVVWSLAGETRLPYYPNLFIESSKKEEMIREQEKGWVEVAKYVRKTDSFKNILTTHPSTGDEGFSTKHMFWEPSLFDIEMLHTGHSIKNTIETLNKSLSKISSIPVINGEVCYEGFLGSNFQNTQRFLFWTHMLSGGAGYTYGADGIWGFRSDEDYKDEAGKFSSLTWSEAMNLPGSYQIGLAKKFLEKLEWYKFERHPEWVTPHESESNIYYPYCAGIPGKLRVIYIPVIYLLEDLLALMKIKINSIEKDLNYKGYFFNPRTGEVIDEIDVKPNDIGEWSIPNKYGIVLPCPTVEDWVLVLEKLNREV